jgi:lambda family phage portal protein
MNLIDRAIAVYSPARAVQRVQARAQLGMFDAALSGSGSTASARGGSRWWNPFPRDARSDTLPGLAMERGKSRELARTSPIACGAINTNVDRVVGTGLALAASPNRGVLGWTAAQASAWKRQVQAEFSLWSDSAESDQAQTLNFYEQQALVLRAVLESGDCFTLLPDAARTPSQPYALRLQVLEADRVGNPYAAPQDTASIAGGVRFGLDGAPAAYHVYTSHPGATYTTGKDLLAGQWVDRLGASGRKRMLHHFRKLRPDMPRGMPYLAPIIDCIKQISRYTDAEIAAAVISAYFTVFIESESGNPAPVFAGEQGADTPGADISLGMGAVVGLAKGEKASFANPNRPNPNFEPFILGVISQIGMALGIPRELLIKQFNSSYSASKAALLDAWIYFRSVRTWLSRSFCQPVYETWLAEAVAIGRVSAPGFFTDPLLRWAYTRAAWHGDSMGSINPKDEVAGFVAAIDARIMTRERAEWELLGSDFYESFDQKKDENDLLASANMLPVPKAGAAAPAQFDGDAASNATPDPASQSATRADLSAMSMSLHDALHDLSARAPGAPVINVTPAPVTVNAGATHVTLPEGCIQMTAPVTVNAGATHVTLPEGCIQLEATVHSPPVHLDIPPAQIVVQPSKPQAMRQVHRLDDDGNLVETITTPIGSAQ